MNRRDLVLAAPAAGIALALPAGAEPAPDLSGETWDAARGRVLYALDQLKLPRDEFDAIVEEHGDEIAAWFDGAEERGEGVVRMMRFCPERGICLTWVVLGDIGAMLQLVRNDRLERLAERAA